MAVEADALPAYCAVQEDGVEQLEQPAAGDTKLDVHEVMPPIEQYKQLTLDFKDVSSEVLAGPGVKPLVPGWLKPRKDGAIVQPAMRKVRDNHPSHATSTTHARCTNPCSSSNALRVRCSSCSAGTACGLSSTFSLWCRAGCTRPQQLDRRQITLIDYWVRKSLLPAKRPRRAAAYIVCAERYGPAGASTLGSLLRFDVSASRST